MFILLLEKPRQMVKYLMTIAKKVPGGALGVLYPEPHCLLFCPDFYVPSAGLHMRD